MEDSYCECGQYLTKFFVTIACVIEKDSIKISGIKCPAKGCEKSYTFHKSENSDGGTTQLLRSEVSCMTNSDRLKNMLGEGKRLDCGCRIDKDGNQVVDCGKHSNTRSA